MMNALDQYSPMQSALALLQPTISYAQKRADANQALAYQTAITQQSQQQVEAARQQALLAQQAQAQLMSVPFMEKDQERWKNEVDNLKKKIRSRVENDFGGDYESYAKTMLEQDIQGLALDAQRSPLYTGALERRSNYVQAKKDAEDGKILRSVTYRTVNGQQKSAPWEQAYQDFHNGDTEELPYNGGFKVDGKWRKAITDQYSPRVGTIGKFKPDQATSQEIASALVGAEGLSGQDAQEYIQRTKNMLAPVYYKFDPRDPYREEQLRQGRVGLNLRAESNDIARDRNKMTKKALGDQIDAWDFTFNNPDNIKSRNADGSPGSVTVTHFDPNLKQEESRKLQRFDGRWLGDSFVAATGAVKDPKTGNYRGAGGWAYVAVKNKAGGVDLRATSLDGVNYTTTPGDIFRYRDKASPYQEQTGQAPYKYMQEQVITISSDEAKKARAGRLFRGAFDIGQDYSSGFNPFGNSDTPTGKGAYTTRKNSRGETVYEFRVLQSVVPSAIDRTQSSLNRMNTQGTVGQAVLSDADDDLNYY
jgi:hypothetical protein